MAERPAMAEAVVSLLRDPSAGNRLANRARILARNRYDWESIGASAASILGTIVEGSR